ncbi:2-dehydro-3-deoxygalactonokinase [Pleomorphomonas sp. PLEO]|uniref:2-dehydro-3-deoxygalactonokinase n=1 Tax=Pleomorphomonas sp. PLEO TaxID=3239306 RepID=UPI00351F0219
MGHRQTGDGQAAFIAIDWGTSSFRAWLMAADGTPLAERRGEEGMRHCATAGFETVFRRHIAALGGEGLPTIICGMAGARQGWREAPYLETPTRLDALHAGAVRVDIDGDVRILPGVAQASSAEPDVMRGEETQILGSIEPGFTGLVCIPGTHSKWVVIEDGAITAFTTYMTGELFALVAEQSVVSLALDKEVGATPDSQAFSAGLGTAESGDAALTSSLFRIRSAMLLGFANKGDGAARLSGLLIGTEMADALRRYGRQKPVRLIATGSLAALYEAALAHAGFISTTADAELASRRGLARVALALWNKGS